jgi:SAM-dependent methyltransferase
MLERNHKMSLPKLLCPVTQNVLTRDGDWLLSAGERKYPIVQGVPVIVDGVEVKPAAQPISSATLTELADALGVGIIKPEELQQVFSHGFFFKEAWMQTEADQFIHRVAASHEGVRSTLNENQSVPIVSSPTNMEVKLSISTQFWIERVRPSDIITINIRVQNSGSGVVTSTGENPVALSYLWHGKNGEITEGLRTPLLIDLNASTELTVPVFIQTPPDSGQYKLQICPVHEGVRWLSEDAIFFRVDVNSSAPDWRQTTWRCTSNHFTYMDDHLEGIRVLEEWRDKFIEGRPVRLVELGGNANPMIEKIKASVRINIDVDPYGMIVGNMLRKGKQGDLIYIVADGMNLPLERGWADIICMFAAFHHFPDPTGLLKHLAQFVAPDGLIVLLCEPIGHVHRDSLPPEFLNEIEKGVNEQSFEFWEYAQMFESAGLEVVDCQIDVGSLKVALRPVS